MEISIWTEHQILIWIHFWSSLGSASGRGNPTYPMPPPPTVLLAQVKLAQVLLAQVKLLEPRRESKIIKISSVNSALKGRQKETNGDRT